MGMFDFLKKKDTTPENSPVKLYAPANGKLIPIEEVADPVFSQKMMGDGFAVIPTDGKITSPAAGKVLSVFPTQHAVGLLLENGVEILLHMGLDTVELSGGPFETVVKEGDQVTPETVISTVDLAALEAAGKDNAMVVVFTNMDKVSDFNLSASGDVSTAAEIGSVTANA
ncbi:PTS system, maltose and glucose-specific IIC component [Carnobacterium antarcticum]|nr:PTS system, maltose and glucose-specific IIC component [Carnobacterium sp. CP1]